MPDKQGNETWQDWWDKHQAEQSAAIRNVTHVMKHRSLGKSEGGVEFVSPDASPDAQEILMVGSILRGDGE